MRRRGEPGLSIWQLILEPYHGPDCTPVINLHEDNSTTCVAARTGKNPTMTTLERGHGVQIGWINERLVSGDYNLIHTRTQHMAADIYTKYFSNPETWQRLLLLIHVYTPE